MADEMYLYERLKQEFGRRTIERVEIPTYITDNLNPKFEFRPYQISALQYFLTYWEEDFEWKPRQNHRLLFQMATGSGKTLMMAGLMIYLYKMGYRNFLFFVNSNNIIDKTKDNFLNSLSSKYLFAQDTRIVDHQINIREVDNFQTTNPDDINIVFSTIQGLHSRLNNPQENSFTFDDFENQRIVLLSDEAHHINADTKKGKQLAFDNIEPSWENTVERIFQANVDNVLLEFTATADLTTSELASKYNSRLIFDYSLKSFREDRYSKEVKVLQSDLDQWERTLLAIIISQYRRKIFERHKLSIKPVVLLKSKTIGESQDFFMEFIDRINNLSIKDLKAASEINSPIIKKAFEYFSANKITLDNLIAELKEDFSVNKLITVNSKDESESKQIAVNTLEDKNNEYRVVFTVNMLNEGWDVLNLFDIVRLYETRDGKSGLPGKTTVSEAQLIGRGARYCPFRLSDDDSLFERKYDDDIDNPIRICEELYYHCFNEPRYVAELNKALVDSGIKALETKQVHLTLKDSFKSTPLYKTGLVFINERIKDTREDIFSVDKYLIDKEYKVSLRSRYTKESGAFEKQGQDDVVKTTRVIQLNTLGYAVIRKAMNMLLFYRFSTLKVYFPNLKSTKELLESDSYLGKIKVAVTAISEQHGSYSPDERLEIAISVLNDISKELSAKKSEYIGTKEFKPYMIKDKFVNKTLSFAVNESEDKEAGIGQFETTNPELRLDLRNVDWFAFNDNFGTSEEKYMVKYIEQVYSKLQTKYDDIYLVRNERFFKIYNFSNGKPTEPDFVLFLVKKESNESIYYQVFIEPKGGHLIKQDQWKEDFLTSIREEGFVEQLWRGHLYNIWGMPFYSEANKSKFSSDFEASLIS